MVIVYGWGSKRKVIKDAGRHDCRICGEGKHHFLVKSYSYFTLFFIPVLFWGKRFSLVCSQCGETVFISKKDIKEIVRKPMPKQAKEDLYLKYKDLDGDRRN